MWGRSEKSVLSLFLGHPRPLQHTALTENQSTEIQNENNTLLAAQRITIKAFVFQSPEFESSFPGVVNWSNTAGEYF